MRFLIVVCAMSLNLVMAACSSTSIGEIRYTPQGEITAGHEIVLEVPVVASKPVRYQWTSQDGGSFDDFAVANPRFKVPQKDLVRISCLISIGDSQPIQRNATLRVHIQDVSTGDASPELGAPAVDPGQGPVDILRAGFVPSGWMGDGATGGRKYLTPVLNSPDDLNVHPNCQKWRYTPGDARWVAVAYQFPPNNWGSHRGKNWSDRGFREITFWARGLATNGSLPVVEFKAGNGTDPARPFQDTFGAQNDPVRLTADWRLYKIDLTQGNSLRTSGPASLSNVVTGFIFALSADDNPNGATFYLADITYR